MFDLKGWAGKKKAAETERPVQKFRVAAVDEAPDTHSSDGEDGQCTEVRCAHPAFREGLCSVHWNRRAMDAIARHDAERTEASTERPRRNKIPKEVAVINLPRISSPRCLTPKHRPISCSRPRSRPLACFRVETICALTSGGIGVRNGPSSALESHLLTLFPSEALDCSASLDKRIGHTLGWKNPHGSRVSSPRPPKHRCSAYIRTAK